MLGGIVGTGGIFGKFLTSLIGIKALDKSADLNLTNSFLRSLKRE